MRNILFFAIFFTLSCLRAQDTTFTVEDFEIKIDNSNFSVFREQSPVFSRSFNDPSIFTADLNNDGLEEVVVFDYDLKEGQECYSAYIFDCSGSFTMTDSIYSGLKEPYLLETGESEKIIVVTGSPDFDSLYVPAAGTPFSPLVCWAFEDTSLTRVNDEMYDVFIDENEKNIDFIKSYYTQHGSSCETSMQLKQVLAAVYANYMYADEKALAEMILVRFYYCSDGVQFRESINNLL
ncbi:MAG: hypothetical protein ACM3Q2_11180 [Syntrophothermus sp.]